MDAACSSAEEACGQRASTTFSREKRVRVRVVLKAGPGTEAGVIVLPDCMSPSCRSNI